MDKELILSIEKKIGFEIKDKERLYNLLLSKNKDEKQNNFYSNYISKIGESLLNLIKIEYIFKNVSTDLETLKFIDSRTKKNMRKDIDISLDIMSYILKYDDKNRYNINLYYISKIIIGVIYIENNYELAKETLILNIEKIISRFIEEPKYDWYKIIKDWSVDNNIKYNFKHIDKETYDDKEIIKVSLNILGNNFIGYGETSNEAKSDAAYKYFQEVGFIEELQKHIPKMIFEKDKVQNDKLSFLRKSELKEIENVNIEDYWILNQCFVHRSYIEQNIESKYKSNESLSYLGNYVRYLIIDKYIYSNRFVIENASELKSIHIRKRIAHPRINSDLFFKKNFIKYMLVSEIAKESSSIVNGMAKHTISALLGSIFLYDYNLENKFIDLYIKHIDTYIGEFNIKIEDYSKTIESISTIKNEVKESLVNNNLKEYSNLFNSTISSSFLILDGKESVNQQILYLSKEIEINNIYIASGFLYKSGLTLLDSLIKMVNQKSGNLEFIVGSLQHYNKYKSIESKKIIIGMDKDTCVYINELIENTNLQIKTLEESFYHGKVYILEGVEKSCIIVGSSNVSNSAFNLNRELNLLYIVENGDNNYNYFKSWYEELSKECIKIDSLDENYFNNTEIDYITNYSISKVKYTDFVDEINHLNDEEIKFRLNLWMYKNPSLIYSDLGIKNLPEYYLFEYEEYQLIVLESFNPSNSFYCFKNENVEELLFKLKELTRTEIFELSSMDKRGYHINDRNKLELNINLYFTRKYKIKDN